MAFVAEDGTGLSTANSYIAVATADTYQADRGRTDWAAAANADKQTALIRATDYIDQRFGRMFVGYRQSTTQALQWPRLDAYDQDDWALTEIPIQIQKACAEYALISLRQGELAPDPILPVPDQSVTTGASVSGSLAQGEIIREKVGPLETEYQSLSSARTSSGNKISQSALLSDCFIPEYPVADLWIEELLESVASRDVVRA